ncbi:hypothetical protein L195_g009247 [Trifolium pratense]|uniref:Uncharacterized protein n=1 Tax=Trifolium pratense TaxID=57577 RepID=A0A2K3PBE1_TRIPR|nr:hypothetical protein L195_g009247 [Trifolium pratense]
MNKFHQARKLKKIIHPSSEITALRSQWQCCCNKVDCNKGALDEAMSGLWKRKNNIAVREENDALEKAAIVQENTREHSQSAQ